MGYHIGEVAKILGLSRQGVRFFERRGYLRAERQENRYRVFERRDLTAAQQIQDYASVGFTLEEASHLVFEAELPEIGEALAGCERWMDEEIERLRHKKALLSRRRVLAEAAGRSQEPGATQSEAMIYLPLEGEYALQDGPGKHAVERQWMSAYPDALLAKIALHTDGSACTSKGIAALERDAAHLGLPVPEGAIRFAAGMTWTETIARPLGSTKPYAAAYERLRAAGYAATGPMLSIVQMTYTRDGTRWNATQLLMPCQPQRSKTI